MTRRVLMLAAVLAVSIAPNAGRATTIPFYGPLPGPDVLYEPVATAAPFENAPGSGWHERSLRVSGADAYVDGEYMYQDYIFDSYGANTTDAPLAPPQPTPASSSTAFGSVTGDVVYPTDAATYGFDAADLLEFRARLVDDDTIAYRITLNTMLTADAAAVAIGRSYSDATDVSDWGYGIGTLGVHVDDVLLSTGGTVDLARNQISLTAPIPAGAETIRHYVVVGLWDSQNQVFKPIKDEPTATEPGGAHGMTPAPVFNVGFRFESQRDEPYGSLTVNDKNPYVEDEGGERSVGFGHYRDHGQAKALAARDISDFSTDIDLTKLADELTESHVPQHGWINRLYSSHEVIANATGRSEGAQATRPMFLGQVQPYGLYIPSSYDGSRAPLHLLMHSLSSSYNQYAVYTPNQLRQIGDQRDSFLLTPAGRGPDGWYHDEAELDTFEALGDALHRYNIAFDRMTVGGYSMGGYGTLKFTAQYPDLFARGFAVVPPADENILGSPSGGAVDSKTNTTRIADNIRNVPLLMWEGTNDELVPLAGTLQYDKRLDELGYRYTQWLLVGYDHFLESTVDEWAEGRDFLGEATVDRNPEHVVYRAMPEMDNTALGLVHDHAYWVDEIAVSDGARSGLIDARSEATAVGKPEPYTTAGVGALAAPPRGAYVSKGIDWKPTTQEARNAFTIATTDVDSARIWLARTGVEWWEPFTVDLTTNKPVTITFKGLFSSETVTFPASGSYTVEL